MRAPVTVGSDNGLMDHEHRTSDSDVDPATIAERIEALANADPAAAPDQAEALATDLAATLEQADEPATAVPVSGEPQEANPTAAEAPSDHAPE